MVGQLRVNRVRYDILRAIVAFKQQVGGAIVEFLYTIRDFGYCVRFGATFHKSPQLQVLYDVLKVLARPRREDIM